MELFRNANIDWLGKKWYFPGLLSRCSQLPAMLSMLFWHGIPKGVDFKGGTLVYVKFDSTPNEDHIRQAMDSCRRARCPDYAHQRYFREVGQ